MPKLMLKNYLKIALRNLRKQKLYSLINVMGLAIGLAFCVLVLLFVHDELTYDRFHANSDRIYRLFRDPVVADSPINRELYAPIPTGPAMQATFPEVEEFVRMAPFGSSVIRRGGQLFEQEGLAFADPSIFRVFTFPLRFGDQSTALARPGSVVIGKELARKYFDAENPLGQTLSIRLDGEFHEFEVTGVLEEIPANSSIRFQVLLPVQALLNIFESYARVENRWDGTRVITYVQLRDGADVGKVRAQLPQFMNTYMGDLFDQMRQEGTLKTAGPPIVYQLQPLSDVHLNPEVPGGFTSPNDPQYSYVLGGIALAVLSIACINFMILAIGRSAKRVKEVGLRKVVGASRAQLMGQFWGEAFLLTALAFFLGIGLAEALLPVFNELADKNLSLSSVTASVPATAALGGLLLLTGLAAGCYPALVLSGFKPIESLKDKLSLSGSNRFTKTLIVVQFGLSVFLVISTLVMSNQLRYIQNKNLGFQDEQVVVIPVNELDGERMLNLYREALSSHTGVVDITGANVSFATGLWRRGFDYKGELRQMAVFRVDPNYVETLGMKVVQGRNFDPNLASDSTESILVNQAFVEQFGWQDQPLGKVLPVDWGGMKNPKVIGVVENFNYQSLRSRVEPVIIYTNPMDPILNLLVRIRPENMSGTLEDLRATWAGITNEVPFAYSFLDEDMNRLYRAEQRWSRIVGYGSFFAIFIACLGLFGLAGITALQRQKEIGIRKVLGATVANITALISGDFARLVGLAVVLASPLAWYAMNNWLANFAYRTEVGPDIFLVAGGAALAIALATVSWQAVRAALANPVESLRSE
jgi:putative ABC transport system permease protein